MTHTNTQNARDVFSANGLKANTTDTNHPTSGKVIAAEIARLARAGHAVHKGSEGDFTVCKYGLSMYCEDFAELQAFSRKLGVTK
jgi:hypothetical protein